MNPTKPTLITFLGTGRYEQTCYQLDEQKHQSKFVAESIARLCDAGRVKVLATPEAEQMHGNALQQALANHDIPCDIRLVPSGSNNDELWALFEGMRACLESVGDQPLIVDITHGFRAQPFFASSVIAMLRATEKGCGNVRVLYGEFRREEKFSPIWELTLFVNLLDWVNALRVFLRTGRADSLNQLSEKMDRGIRSMHVASGGSYSDMPLIAPLVKALNMFADDLVTVRVASMLLGLKESPPKRGKATAEALLESIQRCRADVADNMRPLAVVLDDLEKMVEPLCGARSLAGEAGHPYMLALARLYLKFGRYAEAAAVVREGYICLHAPSSACDVGRGFSDKERKKYDTLWAIHSKLSEEVADIRNDIEHAGFRSQPLAGNKLRKRIEELVEKFAKSEPSFGCEVEE